MIDRIAITKSGTIYWLGGQQVTEAEYRAVYPAPEARSGAPMGAKASSYPYAADSLGVHPDQVAEAMADAAACGVPTDFAPDGSIMWKSRRHQMEYCQKVGTIDQRTGQRVPVYNKDENWSPRNR